MFLYLGFFKIFDFILKEKKKLFSILIFFFLIGITTLRSIQIGNDTVIYFNLFESIKNNTYNLNFDLNSFEFGFIVYTFLISRLFNFRIYLLITNIVILFPYYLFITKYSKNHFLSWFIFFFFGGYSIMVNTIRISMAISIVLIGFYFHLNKNNKLFFISILFSSFFHYTSIINLFSFFILLFKKNISNFLYYFIFLLSLILLINFNQFILFLVDLFPKYEDYLVSEYFSTTPKLAVFVKIFFQIFLLYPLLLSFKLSTFKDHFYFKLSIIAFFFLVLALRFNLLTRIADYFMISFVIVPTIYFDLINFRFRNIYKASFYISIIVWFYLTLIFRPEWNYLFPYKFFWENTFLNIII